MAVKAQGQITLSSIIDVKATYRYYCLRTSNLSTPSKPTAYPPPLPWDDTEPSYTEGSTNSLYLVDCTVFCDDTFLYSEVSLSSSYEAAKEAYNKAVDAATKATHYMDFIPGTGLIVSDLRNSDSTDFVLGRNILIDSDSVDIRNGDTVLASYQDNKIFLAKTNPNAEINLCANSAVMKLDNDNDGDPNITWNTFKITSEHSLLLDALGEVRVGSSWSYFADEEEWTEHPNSYERQCGGSLYISSADKWTIDDPKNFNPTVHLEVTDWYDSTDPDGSPSTYSSLLMMFADHAALSNQAILEDYFKTAMIELTAQTSEDKSQINLSADEVLINDHEVWGYGFAETDTNKTYPGLIRPDGTDTGYVRTPQTGLLPYKNGGYGTVGTSSWPFNNGYFKNIDVSGVRINSSKNIVLPNNKGLFSDTADGSATRNLLFLNSANECVVGYGGWTADVGSTRIYGKQIKAYSKDLGINFRLDRTKPYFEAGDSVSCNIYTAGYTTSSAKQIWFTVPLAKPVVGNPTVTVAWRDGIVCRQNIKYTHGSNYTNGATVWSKLGTLEGHLRADGNYMSVCATMTDTTNANNNSTIGIMASIKITFS